MGVSGISFNENKVALPSRLIRCLTFISGMIFTELTYGAILVISGDESMKIAQKESCTILSIETLLGIAVFGLFFAIAIGFKFLKNILRR